MYEERPSSAVPGAVLWRAGGAGGVVLPDGCMDLLWVEGRLLVVSPDTGPHPPGRSRAAPSRGSGWRPAPHPHCSAYRPACCGTGAWS